LPHFSPGNNVRIIGFDIIKKSKYERGDASHCIALTPTSIVENIPLVCVECRLTPDTTINALLEANDDYSVGSFAAIVSGCHQSNHQFEMYVKDGETTHDIATVSISIQTSIFI
jgi:hypothetical protein